MADVKCIDLLEPDALAQEIADDLQTALEQFAGITTELRGTR